MIPLIDLAAADGEVRRSIDLACRDWGAFQFRGHGLDDVLLSEVMQEARLFFSRPKTEKHAVLRTERNAWGFYDRELTKNTRDWKEVFDFGPDEDSGPLAGTRAQWPWGMPRFRSVLEAYYAEISEVARRLLRIVSQNLGMSEEYLEAYFEPRHSSFLRLNYYPVCTDPAAEDSPTLPQRGHLGINQHTDAGALTLLLQDGRPGLQILRDGSWHTVQPQPGALTVNVGDIVQVWSNDRYRAPVHRVVVHATQSRYSVPFFYNPGYEACYAPLQGVLTDGEAAHYRTINWGEFRFGRMSGDYADYGHEVQIEDFRVTA